MFEDLVFRVSVSVSYIVLFFVLTFFKYEVIFRIVVILVAATGFLYPILYGLPYIIILWRILVGLKVETHQKLYIARHIEQTDMDTADFSNSTTLNHWAVAIEDGDKYFYTHAVGNVISGKGKKRFKEMKQDKQDEYCFHPVGYVTQDDRRKKISQLVDDEPMVSGNSCQEYAVDIAFQLSSSRTYTFVKIMALPRMRNTILIIAVAVSTALAVFNLHPYASVLNLPLVFNLFAAWELSRIGIHNQAQNVDLRYISAVFRAYIGYIGKVDFILLLFSCLCFAFLYYEVSSRAFAVICSLVFVLVLWRLR